MTLTAGSEELEMPTREEALENQFYSCRRDYERQRRRLERLQPDINCMSAVIAGGIAAGGGFFGLFFGLPFGPFAVVLGCVEAGVLGLWGMLTVYLKQW